MSNPGTLQQAGMVGYSLLHRSLPGKRSNTRRRCQIAVSVAEMIYQRFGIGPYQWKLKNCIWYLDFFCSKLSHHRRYQHWLVVRELLSALGQFEWIVALEKRSNAVYLRPTGDSGDLKVGRPANLPRKSK